MHLILNIFDALALPYFPEKIGYKKDAYATKHIVVFLDCNSHLNRPQLQQADGPSVFVAKFKTTKKWYLTPISCAKTYSNIPTSVFFTLT